MECVFTFPLLMQWTAPATGIAMCQVSESIDEPLMSPFGYKQTSSRPNLMSASPLNPDILVAVTDFRC